jgi:hypothetical protein
LVNRQQLKSRHKYEEEKNELNNFLQFHLKEELDFRQENHRDAILVLT